MGYSRVDVVNRESGLLTDSQQISSLVEVDDHNNPAVLQIEGCRLIAAYARHSRDEEWFSRLGTLDRKSGMINWQEECEHALHPDGSKSKPNDSDRVLKKGPSREHVTYCNLMRLSGEQNRIFNFFRGLNFNPCFSFSDDDGQTWSAPELLMKIGDGRTRPYVKYFCDGVDRIDFLFTEAHPRDHDTSIYHCFYQAGELFRTNGERIGSLPSRANVPINPIDSTLVFDGASQPAWVWDLRRTISGELYAVFVVSHDGASGNDLRYHYATVQGSRWHVEEVAYAGQHLYEPENHYAGGVVIDAVDPNVLYVSSNVDPTSGAAGPVKRNRMYVGERRTKYAEFIWTPVKEIVGANQLRPYSTTAGDHGSLLLWLEGEYRTYRDYSTQIRWLEMPRPQ
ncbi:MAG: hypothetical protein Aurels2KO_50870 [Aureliella sp.]